LLSVNIQTYFTDDNAYYANMYNLSNGIRYGDVDGSEDVQALADV